MENITLNKKTNKQQIVLYFQKIYELSQSGEEFPVDLDKVWMLVYSARNKAVNELKNTKDEFGNKRFIKDIDYQALDQKVQAGPGTSTKTIYKLSLSGLEWFIARKVRAVFEVYRTVFHQTKELLIFNPIVGVQPLSINGIKLYPLYEVAKRANLKLSGYQIGGYRRHFSESIVSYNGNYYASYDFLIYWILSKKIKNDRKVLKQKENTNQLKIWED